MNPGIHQIGADDYHADPCDTPSLSASIACILINQSPAHARAAHPRFNEDFEREAEPKFDLGTAAHGLFLQGDANVRVVYADSWRTKEAKELREEAYANGQTPLLEKDWLRVQAMASGIREQTATFNADPPLFDSGKPEQTLVWEDHGITCRARLDWLHNSNDAIDDIKTTGASANPAAWGKRTMYDIGADLQCAFYLRGIEAVTGRTDVQFRYVIVETKPPYALSVVSLPPAVLTIARKKVQAAIELWGKCLANDSWPGYPTQVCYPDLPGWIEAQWLERELREVAA